MKRQLHVQKFKEARQLALQNQKLDESCQSATDSDNDEEEEEEERQPEFIDIQKISADKNRRGKSVHHTMNRGGTSGGNIQKQKSGLKNTIKNAFRNFF